MLMHFLICIFILPGRFEDGYGWQVKAGYFAYPDVPNWTIYLDAVVYCLSNADGAAASPIFPLTNAELLAACLSHAAGNSICRNYYSRVATDISINNKKYMENQ